MSCTGIVMVTCDRRARALQALARIDGVPVCLVDNASRDGTAEAVRARFPAVEVVACEVNLGAAARNVGAARLGCELTAFADDDSWWAPGALERAEAVFADFPRLGLLAARVLVGPHERLDPVCEAMGESALGRRADLPGPSVLGFVACGSIVRTEAFLGVGGFDARYGVGGEEALLAVDLAAAGWDLAYVSDVVAHHHPADCGRDGRRWREVRNDLWSAWLRRPVTAALRRTAGLLRETPAPVGARAGLEAVRGLPWVVRERRVVGGEVEAALARLDRAR